MSEELGINEDAADETVHGDYDHHEAQSNDDHNDDGHGHNDYANDPVQSDNDHHDDGHGHDDYADDTDANDPAPKASNDPSWKHAMDEEMKAIESNNTWSLVTRPLNHTPIGLKWVYTLKKDTKGAVVEYKATLVAKDYVQRQGVDHEEVFAPAAQLEIVRLLQAMAAQEDWKVHHMDAYSTLLNGDLTEEVYVEQPLVYEKKDEEEKVYKLKKALYGLKQVPRAWNSKLDQSLVSLGCNGYPPSTRSIRSPTKI